MPQSSTPLLTRLDRIRAKRATAHYVPVSCPLGRHPEGCPHTPAERAAMSPVVRLAREGRLPAAALTTEVGR